ncbi:MAG: DNA cytosine methyltransferase [Synergistaceae bacterium]|nr:DNA cytosine methyltransferase [Synergistaceae bacterium]
MAGKRAGLDGERSGLFHQAIRIIKEMREATNGKYPRYAVWENVSGAFSSSGGNDFKAVLEAFIGVKEENVSLPAPEKGKWAKADVLLGDGWSVAYRTFDSQYWGVAQRRTRIYLVADFDGESAGEVLFKSDGLSGYSEESCRAWQRIARGTEIGSRTAGGQFCINPQICVNPQGSSGLTITEGQTGTLVAQDHGNHPAVLQSDFPVLNDQGGDVMGVTDNVTCTLRAQSKHPPCVIDEQLKSAGFCTEHSAKARSIGYEEEKSPTLRAGVVPAALSIENHPTDSRVKIAEDGKVQTLCGRAGTGGGNVPMIAEPDIKAFGICSQASHSMMSDNPHSGFYEATTSRTLDKSGGNSVCSNQGGIAVVEAYTLGHDQAQKVDVAGALNCSISHLSSNQGGTAVVNGVNEAGKEAYEAENAGEETNNAVETYDVRFTSEGTRNARGHCYKTDTCRCLDTGGEEPSSNHGGIAVIGFACNQRDEVRDLKNCAGAIQAQPGMKQQTFVIQGSVPGRQDKNGPNGSGISEDVCFTLNTIDRHAIAMPSEDANKTAECDKADKDTTYATTVGSFMHAEEERANTLMARDYKDPQIINDKKSNNPAYIVRRLTPTECARLQAFPDWWCENLETPNPSDEEIAFWKGVWDEWNGMNNKKPKTENQIRKWLADPYSDAAEYSLWGNGLTVTIPWYIFAGVIWALDKEQRL